MIRIQSKNIVLNVHILHSFIWKCLKLSELIENTLAGTFLCILGSCPHTANVDDSQEWFYILLAHRESLTKDVSCKWLIYSNKCKNVYLFQLLSFISGREMNSEHNFRNALVKLINLFIHFLPPPLSFPLFPPSPPPPDVYWINGLLVSFQVPPQAALTKQPAQRQPKFLTFI